MRALRRAVAGLPVDEPTPRPSRRRPKGFYVPHPYFAVMHAGRTDSFLADAMPADAAPLARQATRLLHGAEGRCVRDLQRFHAG